MQKLLFTHLLVVLLTLSSFSYGDDKLLIVGSEQDYPPFALGLTDSTADGFTVELWRAVAAEAHINSTIRVLPFRDILYEFKAKEIDVLINLAQSDERRLFADFTVPHVIVRGAIFVRKGESSISSEAALQNKRIIVLSADLAHDYAVSKGWKNQLTLVGTAEEGFQLLASGQHDALLLSKLAGQQTLEKLGLTNIEALHIPIGFAQKFSFAVHKGNAELLAKINEGLALTKVNGVYDALYDKWFGVYEEKALLPTVLKYLAPVVGLFLIIMGISFYRRHHESKQYVQKLQANKASLEADLLADITLRKGLETELKNMIARKDMAINALNAGVFVWRFDTNELIWDKCMRRLYGVPEGTGDTHLYYDAWLSLLHPDDKKNTESLLLGAIAGTNSFDTEFRIVLDNDDTRYIRAAAILERDENAYPIQMVGVNLDITDIKTAEARIIESNASLEKQVEMRTSELNTALEVAKSANAAKTDFLANMSHEIRTPMNAVIGLAFLLQKQELNLIARDMVNKIDDAGRSLLGVINECLDFSKIEANLLEIEYVPFRLSDILDNLTSIMNILGANKPIKLCIAPAPKGSDYLRGDPIRLEQILINLVSNAIKFTEKGEVVVEVHVTDSVSTANKINIHFSVRDTGIGISREKHESIFQPFVQADNSTTRVYGGSGLGLAISRRLVDLMGGTLQLTSEIGVGSVFFFDLTFTVVGNIKPDAVPSLPPQNVLIIDNNNIARKLLEATVISLGWKAQLVDSDVKALQILTRKGANYFDFLLLDWSVVAGNGKQVAIRIQQQFGKEHCPIIIMVTAHNRDILLTQSSDNAYFDNIISKPVTGLSLTNAVLEVKMKRGELVYDHNQSASAEPLKGKYNQLVSAEPLKGLNVLVVDDSEINREVARQILTGEGATIEDAENGLDAINQLKAKPNYFHVVLMDVQMPVMDGYTATQQIRMLPELKHLPIIALTAGAFKSHRIAALEAGMDDFIAKPFDVDELVACVQRLAQPKQIQKTSVTIIAPQLPQTSYKDIPLIDIDNGLKKWRDPALYQKHLRLFLTQHAQNVNLVHEKLLNTDNTAALAITHKLLGAAGALSLQRIVHVIKNLDEAIREQNDVKTESECFSLVFAQTLDAIHKYLDNEIQQQTEELTLAVSPISIIKGLEQLIVTLDSDDPDLIEPQLATLAGQLPKAAFAELAIAIENFDFREAETLATVLLTAFFDTTQE